MTLNKLVVYYSVHKKEFLLYRAPDQEMCRKAIMLSEDFFIKFDSQRIKYSDGKVMYILTIGEYKSCTCVSFASKLICKHLTAASSVFDFDLLGFTRQQTFNVRAARGKKSTTKGKVTPGSALEKD